MADLLASHAPLLLAFAAVAVAIAGTCREHRPSPDRPDAWDLWSSSSGSGDEEEVPR